MSRPGKELHEDTNLSRPVRRSHTCPQPTMDHRKVTCGTCRVPLLATPSQYDYHYQRHHHHNHHHNHHHHHRHQHKHRGRACQNYTYSIKQQCATAFATNTNGNTWSGKLSVALATGRRRHNTKTICLAPPPPPRLLVLFALLNLTLLAPPLKPVASAPASGQLGGGESTIKVTRFQVPAQVRPGELRRLTCLYELNGATLHALKLFKDEKEFYRFTPNPGTPSDRKMTFPVVGVHVELNRSNEREVWLKTSKRSTGQYKCQVSIEGTFNSISAEKRMEVVDGGGQFGSNAAGTGGGAAGQSASGYLAGAGVWQQQQQQPFESTNRQHNSFSMTSPRAQSVGQRHALKVSGVSSNTATSRHPISLSCWSMLSIIGSLLFVAQITLPATTQEIITARHKQ